MVDFQALIIDLRAKGWTDVALGEHCEVARSTITALAAGRNRDPRYSLGQALIDLAIGERIKVTYVD